MKPLRYVSRLLLIGGLTLTGSVLVDVSPARADGIYTKIVNGSDDTTRSIYNRSWPSLDASERVYPKLGFYGDDIEVLCGVNGESAGRTGSIYWHKVQNLSRPERWVSYLPHDYVSGTVSEEPLLPGERPCNRANQDRWPSPKYNRAAAASFATKLNNEEQYTDDLCTWFASKVLWAGGLPQTDKWQESDGYDELGGLKFWGDRREGTRTANAVNLLRDYLVENGFAAVDPEPLNFHSGIVPEAKVGDLIMYDWEGDGTDDHFAVITKMDEREYADVSEWTTSTHYYPNGMRGWTWSERNKGWLYDQHPLITAKLVHILY